MNDDTRTSLDERTSLDRQLFEACAQGKRDRVDRIQSLLQQGANVNARGAWLGGM
jgi:hypothetical protein